MSLSVLLQQGATCLVRLIWMVLEMGGRWPFSYCFMGYYIQDLFNIAHRILAQFQPCFFSIHLISVCAVHPYSRLRLGNRYMPFPKILA